MDLRTTIIPGLLQTEDYARHVIRGMLPEASDDEVERRVETRMRRQAVLDGLKLWAIIDEAALRRQVGTPAEMRAQMEHLRQMMRRPGIVVQALPFEAGAHPAMLGAFAILKFIEPVAPDIVYVEGLSNDLFLDDDASIKRYADTFEHLRAGAASPASTNSLLRELAE
ncbi:MULTISPECIES: DUF5753 domain-containing protein [Actinomadura]|uniref:DUF5753 domain-containing protein n=1 Tax=Actinomadura yumaensis TaxID=111807 RepID=A0ABW2D0E6_9ACTN|nr:DUF5753 domain-containing protein [Actinomadura sp. J1-007]